MYSLSELTILAVQKAGGNLLASDSSGRAVLSSQDSINMFWSDCLDAGHAQEDVSDGWVEHVVMPVLKWRKYIG